ncbi:MAG: hypothetical protein JST67_00065 [Bacteroidetes bacterium]|nr:hypothetical protein [Bacteroidota bacterium]
MKKISLIALFMGFYLFVNGQVPSRFTGSSSSAGIADSCSMAVCYAFKNSDLYQIALEINEINKMAGVVNGADSCNLPVCQGFNNLDLYQIYMKLYQLKAKISGGIAATDTSKVPLAGTAAGHPLRAMVEVALSDYNLTSLATKNQHGMSIGYGDMDINNLYSGTNNKYAASTWVLNQNYHQFYDNTTMQGAELNLTSQDGSGGNGIYAQIGALDFSASNGGCKLNWVPDSVIAHGNNSKNFRGIVYDAAYIMGPNSLIYRTYADSRYQRITNPYKAVSGSYSIAALDNQIDCQSGTYTLTLPSAIPLTGIEYVISDSGTGTITIATTGSQTINGVSSYTLTTQWTGVRLRSTGANWVITGKW